MYALITEPDGRVELSLQVPPEALSANDARILLRTLEPLVADLREQVGAPAAGRRTAGAGARWSKAPRRRRSDRATT